MFRQHSQGPCEHDTYVATGRNVWLRAEGGIIELCSRPVAYGPHSMQRFVGLSFCFGLACAFVVTEHAGI